MLDIHVIHSTNAKVDLIKKKKFLGEAFVSQIFFLILTFNFKTDSTLKKTSLKIPDSKSVPRFRNEIFDSGLKFLIQS